MEIQQKFAERTGMSIVDGPIDYGYTRAFVGRLNVCPRCQSATAQRYSTIVYLCGDMFRTMFTAGGHFCTASTCSTVILDEELIKQTMTTNAPYYGVVGMAEDIDEFSLLPFKMLDGEKPLYDEDGEVWG